MLITAEQRTASLLPAHASQGHGTGFGEHLRAWRLHRKLSQLDLAEQASLSTRHLSCLETGKANPSREVVLRLSDRLAVPLRQRNVWLVAAGYAPMYREHGIDDPKLSAARRAIQQLLDRHEPWPAVAFDRALSASFAVHGEAERNNLFSGGEDATRTRRGNPALQGRVTHRHWNLVLANRMVGPFLHGVAPDLLAEPINLLRISLHPQGLAPKILNLNQWREHLFARLVQQIQATGDQGLMALLAELRSYPGQPDGSAQHAEGEHPGVLMPFLLQTPQGVLSLISTTTVFGSPTDITLQELALETFFPGDEASAQWLQAMAASLPATQG